MSTWARASTTSCKGHGMLERFVDTSGWAAWADRREEFHPLAVAAVDEVWKQGGRLVTNTWVLAELTSLLTRPLRWVTHHTSFLALPRSHTQTVFLSNSALAYAENCKERS